MNGPGLNRQLLGPDVSGSGYRQLCEVSEIKGIISMIIECQNVVYLIIISNLKNK